MPPASRNPLVRPAEAHPSTRRPRWLLPLAALGALVLLGAALVGRGLVARGPAPQQAVTASLELAGPTDDPDNAVAPRVLLRLSPVAPGENAAAVRLADVAGTPLALPETPTVRLGVASLDDPASERVVEARLGEDGVAGADLPLAGAGWWRIRVASGLPGGAAADVPFYALLPDPNLHGEAAVETPPSDPVAEAVYTRGAAATEALHRVRFRQRVADGSGHVAWAEHEVNDGADGQPPAFSYRSQHGLNYVLVGGWRWLQMPGEGWTVNGAPPMIPPSEWDHEKVGATGFRLGGVEEVDGERCRIVTFVVPARPGQAVAWYAWWVGEETGQVRRETMVARLHYMVHEFRDFDAPIPIAPPFPPPPEATPVTSPVP